MDKLVDKIKEDTSGASVAPVGPVTVQDGNTSISYIPGGFVRKEKLPKGVADKVDEAARTELIHKAYDRLLRVMSRELRDKGVVASTLVLANYWLSLFPNSTTSKLSDKVTLDLSHYDSDVRKLVDQVRLIYEDDLGNIQMLTNSILDGRALNAFDPFSEHEYLVGARLHSTYEKIELILELTVNMSMIATNSILIGSTAVADELEGLRSARVVNRVMFPVGPMFTPSVFREIKLTIDSLAYDEEL